MLGDRDQLIQVFLNLVRNAADALPDSGGEITLTTGYRPGVRFGAAVAGERLSLPLEVTVRDNGSGVPADLMPYIFDPFVTTKVRGSGPGPGAGRQDRRRSWRRHRMRIVPRRTIFRVLLPKASGEDSMMPATILDLPTTTAPSAPCSTRRWAAPAMTCAPPAPPRACGAGSRRATAIW